MATKVETHYTQSGSLARHIADALFAIGKDTTSLQTGDLSAVDEFHIRGRKATLEIAARMRLHPHAKVLDIGSGLGGPARTIAEAHGCVVTGIDLTSSFCEAARELSKWTGQSERVSFVQGDATDMPFTDASFDAAMTMHVGMNIVRKDLVYGHAKRVLRPGGIFAVYDVLQGEGGAVYFPVPWAREPSISHLATPAHMRHLLSEARFDILDEIDSSEESLTWFRDMTARMAAPGGQGPTVGLLLGPDFPEMVRNQIQNLAERRIRTVTFVCQA